MNIPKFQMDISNFQMAEYQRKINQLRMLRSDLDEKTIVAGVQNFASKHPVDVIRVLTRSIEEAMMGFPLQWEKEAADEANAQMTKKEAMEKLTDVSKWLVKQIEQDPYLIIAHALADHCFELMKEAGIEQFMKNAVGEGKNQMTESDAKKKIAEVAEWLKDGASGNNVEYDPREDDILPPLTLARDFSHELLSAGGGDSRSGCSLCGW